MKLDCGFKRGLSLEQIQFYAKPEFSDEQMNEIRCGFEDGLSIEQILSREKSEKEYDEEDEDDEEYYDLVVTYDNNKNILFYKSFEVGSEEPYIEKFDEVQEAISVAEKNKNAAAVIIWDCIGSDDLLVWTKEAGELDELEEPDSEYYTNETKKLIDKLSIQDNSNENNKEYIVTYTKIDNNDRTYYESKIFDDKEDAKKFSKSLKDNKKYFYRDIKIKEKQE